MACTEQHQASTDRSWETRSSEVLQGHEALRLLRSTGHSSLAPAPHPAGWKLGSFSWPIPPQIVPQVPSSYCFTSSRFWLRSDTFPPSWVRLPGVSDFDLAGRDDFDGCHRSSCVQIGNDRAPHSPRGPVTQLIPARLKRGTNVKVLWRLALFCSPATAAKRMQLSTL
jgi:hypothetical protein